MKSLTILVLLGIFLAPTIAFAQESTNLIILETSPGSTDIAVTIEGEQEENEIEILLMINGHFESDSKNTFYQERYTVTKDNPTHVFELDYPFRVNEVYFVTADNGYGANSIAWIPRLVTQEVSTNSINDLPLVLGEIQSTSVIITGEDSQLFQSVRDENKRLSQETQKKDAVLMEQVMVIKNMASKISKVKYTSTVELVSLTVAQTELTSAQDTFQDFVQTLSEENNLLTQEIEKKDAVLMEQLKVIEGLAAKLKNTSYESSLSNFSLV